MVKGALFARYSRSPKSLRRLLLDEFLPPEAGGAAGGSREGVGRERAEALYDRVLAEYGDDSVAQLGGAHIAVEGASNLLTKVLQWGRLASYLEQSTRYIPTPTGRAGVPLPPPRRRSWRTPSSGRRTRGPSTAPSTATRRCCRGWWSTWPPGCRPTTATPAAARERAVRARALDLLRGLLPAATTANVGIFASGQAYEAMLIRMGAHPLPEARECAARDARASCAR